jgi:hypothetical protein
LYEQAAVELLKDLDWSLKMLETVNSNQSMGNVAGDKIKRLLNRELSQLSEGSEGAHVAEWVTNITNSGESGVWSLARMVSFLAYQQNPSIVDHC